jgi:hypothetical protein
MDDTCITIRSSMLFYTFLDRLLCVCVCDSWNVFVFAVVIVMDDEGDAYS